MSRNSRPGGPYCQPMNAAGTLLVDEKGRGNYTLVLSTTYYYPLGGSEGSRLFVQLQGDASIVLTSAVIEDTAFGPTEALLNSTTVGDWVPWDMTGADVNAVGAGATFTKATLAMTGGAVFAASWNRATFGPTRARLKVVVAGTGGVLRVASCGKS